MPERTCACGCALPLEGLRSDARYATGACRARAYKRARQPSTPESFWRRHAAIRRPARTTAV